MTLDDLYEQRNQALRWYEETEQELRRALHLRSIAAIIERLQESNTYGKPKIKYHETSNPNR